MNELRENWLNPPDLVTRVPEVVPGYPDRILAVDATAAAILKNRTLTKLYNERPAWLDHAHKDLDDAVAAAYGWPADLDRRTDSRKALRAQSRTRREAVEGNGRMGLFAILVLATCCFGFPAVLGVWSMRLWHGTLPPSDDLASPMGISIGLSLVIAASVFAALAPPEAQNEFGPWFAYLGGFALLTFVMGLIIGWIEHRSGRRR